MAKVSKIQVSPSISVTIINGYHGLAEINQPIVKYHQEILEIKDDIEKKLERKILMSRFDLLLQVLEFYLVG